MNKSIFKFLFLTLGFIVFFSLEVSLAWPIISLVFWLIMVTKFNPLSMPIVTLVSALILSVFWPMSVLLGFLIFLVIYHLTHLLNRIIAQTSLVALLVSWLLVPVIYCYFSLTISWVLFAQLLVSLLIFLLIRKSSLLKLNTKAISFS